MHISLHQMKILFLLLISNYLSQGFCPDDDDLQFHQCQCNLTEKSIHCSRLPNQCQTCYRYKRMYLSDKVDFIPENAFNSYQFFTNKRSNNFTIQFYQLTNISRNAFSNLVITETNHFNIEILQYHSAHIPTRLFENLILQLQAKLHINISSITQTLLTIDSYAFEGILFDSSSQFRFTILSANDSIQFRANAGSIFVPSNVSISLNFSNFKHAIFDEKSFTHITENYASQLSINLHHFESIHFFNNTFIDFHQFEQSNFHLSLSHFQSLIIEQMFFNRILQIQSYFRISIANLTSNLCLSNQTFNQISQNSNSTFEFHVDSAVNLLFSSNTFSNIQQTFHSKFSIEIFYSFDIYFSRYSLTNFSQANQSSIEISIQYGQNLIFEDDAIQTEDDDDRSSLFKISFQNSRGALQMSRNTFSKINHGHFGRLVFELTNTSDFYFRFNQSIEFEKFSLLNCFLYSNDFCRIIHLPIRLPIELEIDNPCSCTIYYLYRFHQKQQLTPKCYSNLTRKQIEQEEDKCRFQNQISDCQQMEGDIQIHIPYGICQKQLQIKLYSSSKYLSYSLVICLIIIFICILILYYHIRTCSSQSNDCDD